MNKRKANTLWHPPPTLRRRYVCMLKGAVQDLQRATTLEDVAVSLLSIQKRLDRTASIYGIEMPALLEGGSLEALANGDTKLLKEPMPGRAPYHSVQVAVLKYAERYSPFTIKELLADNPALAVIGQNSIKASLYRLSKGPNSLLLRRKRPKSPVTFSLRKGD